jgi:hypothetical protein
MVPSDLPKPLMVASWREDELGLCPGVEVVVKEDTAADDPGALDGNAHRRRSRRLRLGRGRRRALCGQQQVVEVPPPPGIPDEGQRRFLQHDRLDNDTPAQEGQQADPDRQGFGVQRVAPGIERRVGDRSGPTDRLGDGRIDRDIRPRSTDRPVAVLIWSVITGL